MNRLTRRSILLFIPLLAPLMHAASAPLPRYHLAKGQHLVYSGSSQFKYVRGVLSDTSTTDIWVTDVRPDGSAKVLFLSASHNNRGEDEHDFLSATVSPDGQVQFDGHPRPGATLSGIFPTLPTTTDAARTGWQSDPDVFGGVKKYSPLPAPTGALLFKAVDDAVENKIYCISGSTTYRFDTARGLVESTTLDISQDDDLHGKQTGGTKLQSVERADPATLAQLAADADTYLAAVAAYAAATRSDRSDPNFADSLATADRPLQDAQAKVSTPAIKTLLADQIARHQRYLPSMKEDAIHRDALLNKPAPDFSTTDYDGKPVKLSDLRGKVVLLDFWYRGCGWCVRAMPQLKQLADDFKDRPVAILGMNTDQDPADARFVIKAMSLNYPTLIAGPYPEKLNIHAFPTLLLIDQHGAIHDIHEGFSPTLRKDIGDQIRALLQDQK